MAQRIVCNGRRYDVAKLIDLGLSTHWEGGTRIVGVYMTPRTKRVLIHTDSIWERSSGSGCVVGRQWHEADADEVAVLAARHSVDELLDLVPAGD